MPCHKTITTAPFAIERQTVTRLLTRRLAARRWFAVALPFMILLAIGICLDTAFAFVALMYLFLVVPTLIMIVYFNEVLRVSAIRSTVSQTVTIDLDNRSLMVTYHRGDTDPDNTPRIDLSERTHKFNPQHDINFVGQHILIHTAPHEYIIIPYKALAAADILTLESL